METINIDVGKVFGSTLHEFDKGANVVIHKGGTGSGKTYEIMMYLLFEVLTRQPNQVITVVSESHPHLKIGVIRYMLEMTKRTGLFNVEYWNKSESVFTYPYTGSILEFFSADRISKALGARRDWLYGNEVNSLSKDVWDELARRSERIIADFNPTQQFWIEEWARGYENVRFIKSNYKDNAYLSDTERRRIERRAEIDANFKRIHVDVEYGVYEGLIFEQFTLIDQMPEGQSVYGMDFGFTADPTTLIRVVETGEAFYVDELIYQTGMLNRDIIRQMEALGIKKHSDKIIADSAEPKSIHEIHLAGFNINGAQKGQDSIRSGIDRLKSKQLYVTKRSINLIKELRNYSWELDKSGNQTNRPIDAFNHGIDALRYATEPPKHNYKYAIA